MSNQYQPTFYYDWPSRNHGITLEGGIFKYNQYEYYAGDEIINQNTIFRDSQYVTYDNTHLRILNQSDIHLYDTSGIKIYDSGTLTIHTSASPDSRGFIVDQIGRVGIGMDHTEPHSNGIELPTFDLDVKGQVGIEDYIYHNDDVDTYMLFGSDLSAHNINQDGSSNTIYPDDQDEINFRVGGIDMLQMQTRDLSATTTTTGAATDGNVTVPIAVANTTNPVTLGTVLKLNTTQYGTIQYKGTHDAGLANTQFDGANSCYIHVPNTTAGQASWQGFFSDIVSRWNSGTPQNNTNAIAFCQHNSDGTASQLTFQPTGNYGGSEGTFALVLTPSIQNVSITQVTDGTTTTTSVTSQDHVTVNKYQSDVDLVVRSETNTSALVVSGDGAEVVINDDGNADTDFRVESDHEDHMLFVDTSVNRISIGDSEDTPQATLEVTNDSDSGAFDVPLVQLNNKDTDKEALDINADNIDANVIDVTASSLTTGTALDITGVDSLTTGKIAYFGSNSPTTGGRNLVQIQNDNELATGTRALYIKNNAIASGSEETVRIESTAADNNPLVELRNSNSAIDTPPVLNFKVTNYTGESTHVDLGTLKFEGQASPSSARVVYAALSARATDMHTDEFGGQFNFMVQATDSPAQLRNMLSIGGQANTSSAVDTQAEVVINEDQIDLDFRVESNTTDNAFIVYGDGTEVVVNENGNSDTDFRVESDLSNKILFVDASADHVDIRGPSNDDTDLFTIHGNGDNDAGGHELLSITPVDTIFNDDGNDIDFRVESQTNTHALYIDGAGSEVVVNDTGRSDTDFRVESAASEDILEGHGPHEKTHALFVDTSTGRVGIGKSSPQTTLHVAGSAHIEGDLWVKGTTNQIDTLVHVTSAMDITNIGTGPAFKVTQTGAQPVAVFYDDNVPQLYLEDGGNIGMSTASPNSYDAEADNLVIKGLEDGTGITIASPIDKRGNIYFADGTNGNAKYRGGICYDHADDDLSFRTNSTEKVWILSGGNVGIGDPAPERELDVDGKVRADDYGFRGDASQPYYYFDDFGGTTFLGKGTDSYISLYHNSKQTMVWNDGKVGIGTDSPWEKLSINDGGIGFGTNSSAVNTGKLAYDSNNGHLDIKSYSTGGSTDIRFYTSLNGGNHPRMYIASDGDVGIMTTTPHVTLYIEAADGLRIPVGTTANRPTSGDFGITGPAGSADWTPMHGTIRYNTTQSTFEGFGPGNTWGSLGGVIDVDRDTYWTAVNDLENIHLDDFDPDNEYPGDVDQLRAFTNGLKRLAIDDNGHLKLYDKTSGAGTTSSKYVYDNYLTILPESTNAVLRAQPESLISLQSSFTIDITDTSSRTSIRPIAEIVSSTVGTGVHRVYNGFGGSLDFLSSNYYSSTPVPTGRIAVEIEGNSSLRRGGNMTFSTVSGDVATKDDYTEHMRITYDGNVGIGTLEGAENPNTKLEVHSGSNEVILRGAAPDKISLLDIKKKSNGDTEFHNNHYTNGNTGNFIFTDGKIGVGTGSIAPIAEIDIYGAGKGIRVTNTHTDTSRITQAALESSTSGDGQLWLANAAGNSQILLDSHAGTTSYINGDINLGTIKQGVWNGTSISTAYTDADNYASWNLVDGDGSSLAIQSGKYVKFVEGAGIDINITDSSTGSSSDPYDITIKHTNTTTQASVSNTGDNVIQNITLDAHGHVTGLSTKSLDFVNKTSGGTFGDDS